MVTVGLGTFVCSTSLPLISSLQHLYVNEKEFLQSCWQDDIEDVHWLEQYTPIYHYGDPHIPEIAPRVAPTLQELVGGRATEVQYLPFGVFSWSSSTHQYLSRKPGTGTG